MRWKPATAGEPLPFALLVLTTLINGVVAGAFLLCTLLAIVVVAVGMSVVNLFKGLLGLLRKLLLPTSSDAMLLGRRDAAESRLP